MELEKILETSVVPEKTQSATFSVILVTLFTLKESTDTDIMYMPVRFQNYKLLLNPRGMTNIHILNLKVSNEITFFSSNKMGS